ncbi:MAG: glucose-1-phosphate adenylyltransferase [Planctomycetes bacterium]|nr:glucose-1-phosphate adenylyltransferase [Planctomycetota bacterium]
MEVGGGRRVSFRPRPASNVRRRGGTMQGVVTAILGGGQGKRLWPLTKHRCKPAVPLGGKFRLIDVPISNSLHAGIDRIYVLTQFNSASLHRHMAQTYRFDAFRGGYVDILAADERMDRRDWYQGTADAIRQNFGHLDDSGAKDVLILSGDQLYLMRVRDFVKHHRENDADLTVAVTAVPRSQAKGLGIMRVDKDGRIVEFVEKPQSEKVLDRLAPDAETLKRLGFHAPPGSLLASMGIYVFRRGVLHELLEGNEAHDFGKEVIPGAIHERRVFSFAYNGYWRDIGTIPAFHEASLELTQPLPPLNLYSADYPIYTHSRFLPGTKLNKCKVEQSILCEGSIISDSKISHSIVGIRAIVEKGAIIESSVVMGAREYEAQKGPRHAVPMGIGAGCHIRNSIVDLNARIGDGAKLLNEAGVQEYDAENYCIRGGIIVVPRDATIAPGTVI